jgi:hypothetical protein
MIYDPYHLGQVYDRLENRFFALRIDDKVSETGSSYFRQLRNHFEYLWRTGTTWEDFAKAHPDLEGLFVMKRGEVPLTAP